MTMTNDLIYFCSCSINARLTAINKICIVTLLLIKCFNAIKAVVELEIDGLTFYLFNRECSLK